MTKFFSVIAFFTLTFFVSSGIEAGVISTAAKAAKKAAKAAEIARKAADAAVNTTGKVIAAPVRFALDPNGFIILNSSTQHIRSTRDSLRKQINCEKKIKLKSSSIVFEKPNINSPQRLIFQQGEAVCVKSETFGWIETPFGWVKAK